MKKREVKSQPKKSRKKLKPQAEVKQEKPKKTKKVKKIAVPSRSTRDYERAYPNLVPSTIRIMTFIKIGLFIGALIQLLFFQPILTAVAFVLAGLYALKVIVPYNIRNAYETQAFVQRNLFVNSMTQILTNPQRTIIEAFRVIIERLEGEFKEDIEVLCAGLTGSNENEVYQSYDALKKKYESDIIFCQYVDQLTTATIEGRTNLDTFKNIKTYHNDYKRRETYFKSQKAGNMKELQSMFLVVFIFIGAICASNGIDAYIRAYAHSMIGVGTNIIFLGLFFLFVLQFYKLYRDDNIWGG